MDDLDDLIDELDNTPEKPKKYGSKIDDFDDFGTTTKPKKKNEDDEFDDMLDDMLGPEETKPKNSYVHTTKSHALPIYGEESKQISNDGWGDEPVKSTNTTSGYKPPKQAKNGDK